MNSVITDWTQSRTGSNWVVQPLRIVQTSGNVISTLPLKNKKQIVAFCFIIILHNVPRANLKKDLTLYEIVIFSLREKITKKDWNFLTKIYIIDAKPEKSRPCGLDF